MTAPKRLLIVDDEEDIVWGIRQSLARTTGLETQIAHSGDEALRLLEQKKYDLVLSDIRMPGCDGLQLLTKIRRRYPDSRVIIMTAYGSPDLIKTVEDWGGFFYIEKPFEMGYLRQIVLEALEIDDNGFRGYVNNVSIRDLVRLNCFKRLSASLCVRRNGENGTIYFKDGDVVHAECGELRGERAFLSMLNWSSGTFKIQPNVFRQQRTILGDWRNLLREHR